MAGNRDIIKGITIKIGGDTTELGKALESVNKKGDDLSNELREINRLLKFDPQNTELLAQKQKVLAGTVENTAKKLETLREAERQVQQQFARGEVSEAQVRALQREIVATEGKLKSYKRQAKEAADGTKELGDTAELTGGVFEGLGGTLANAAIAGIGAVVAGATAAVGALIASAEATREYRTEMGKLITAFDTVGHSTKVAEDAYKTLYSVIGETDQSVEAAQQIALLADSEQDVAQWADLAAGVVGRFGDALQPETFFEAANETIKLGEATGAYVQLLEGAGYDVNQFNAGLAACTTESEKQAYMLKITDELLGDAADTYREVNEEVIRANEANAAWTDTMADVGAAVEPILTDVKMLGASLLGELMPGITGVTDAFRGLINGEEGSAEAVGEAISGLFTQILNKAVELLPTVVNTVLSFLTSLSTTIFSMLPQLTETGISIITAILGGLTTAVPQVLNAFTELLPQFVQTLVDGIPMLIDGALQFFLALLDAESLMLPALIDSVPTITVSLITALLDAIPELIDGALQWYMAIVLAIPLLITKLLPAIPTIVDALVDGLLELIPVLLDGVTQFLFAILAVIPELAAALYETAPSLVASIIKGLLKCIPSLLKAGYQLIEGLIKGMLDFDYMGAISKVGNGIINGFKNLFDIHSPSRVMEGLGEMLDEGLAVGINDNANAPVNALDKLSNDMLESTDGLNGLTLERRMVHAFNPSTTGAPTDGIGNKLDQIYKAILAGQVIMLDSKTLVGSTAVQYDTQLGQRRVLAERGAL